MSPKAKTTKKSKCKYASPISNDRAEAFVGPKPKLLPKFSEVPSKRDKQAFELAAQGINQRVIAEKLGVSQPTIHRGIKKYRLWFGMTLPEDRGELIGWARFRVAVEERKIFLRHQQELAMEQWHESCKPIEMKRKRTKLDPQGKEMDGMPIKDIQIDEWVQPPRANAAHLNAAAKRSDELTMLEAGYLGVHKLTCDKVIDVDERDRWDRVVKSQEAAIAKLTATVAELTQKLVELEARLAARVALADEPTANSAQPINGPSARQPVEHPRDLRGAEVPPESALAVKGRATSCGNTTPTRPLTASGTPSADESQTRENTPAANQNSAVTKVASPVQAATSGERPDSSPPAAKKPESDVSQPPSPIRKPPTYITVLGHDGHHIWLKKPEN